MSTTLLTARQTIAQYTRYAGSAQLYPNQQIDMALSTAADELIRRTNVLQRLDQITFAVGNQTISGVPTNFRPDRLLFAYLTGDNIQVTVSFPDGYSPYYTIGAPIIPTSLPQSATLNLKSYDNVLNESIAFKGTIGQPQDIGFDQTSGTGICFPVPDSNGPYVANLRWNDIFTQWITGSIGAYSAVATYQIGDVVSSGGNAYQSITSGNLNNAPPNASFWVLLGSGGVTNPAALTFNLPDDYLRPVLLWGAPAMLMMAEPEHVAMAQGLRAQFEQFITTMVGKGDLGENVLFMPMPSRGDWSGGEAYTW